MKQALENAPELASLVKDQISAGTGPKARKIEVVQKSIQEERDRLQEIGRDLLGTRESLRRLKSNLKLLSSGANKNLAVREQLQKKYDAEYARMVQLQVSLQESMKSIESLQVEQKAAEQAASAAGQDPINLKGLQ